jgi:hypothetical protein
MKTSNALYNKETGEVVCQECYRPIENVTEAMKRTLSSFGQVIREERKAFMMACKQCQANREVVLNADNETVCVICKEPIFVHQSMRLAMEAAGQKLRQLEGEPAKEEAKAERPIIKTGSTKPKKTTKKRGRKAKSK